MLRQLEESLRDIPGKLDTVPKAVLMISGHWEQDTIGVMSSPKPGMEYDYHGFPEHTYRVKYPAPGSPQLANSVRSLIKAAGFDANFAPSKGFDHGAFAPMAVMYPDADMPLVQLSLKTGLDPTEHLALGRALRPLREEGVLIVGSGLSYHNLRSMGPAARKPSQAFDDWLQDTLVNAPPAHRAQRLMDWSYAPFARVAHPREDHLLPLMVAAGAAETGKATCTYHEKDVFGGMVVSSFRFDD
jgi:aromatic ring-opening dioxygenase catalytic subunit (LigB family)